MLISWRHMRNNSTNLSVFFGFNSIFRFFTKCLNAPKYFRLRVKFHFSRIPRKAASSKRGPLAHYKWTHQHSGRLDDVIHGQFPAADGALIRAVNLLVFVRPAKGGWLVQPPRVAGCCLSGTTARFPGLELHVGAAG